MAKVTFDCGDYDGAMLCGDDGTPVIACLPFRFTDAEKRNYPALEVAALLRRFAHLLEMADHYEKSYTDTDTPPIPGIHRIPRESDAVKAYDVASMYPTVPSNDDDKST